METEERNARSYGLDEKDISAQLALFAQEERAVHEAVEAALPDIARAVAAIVRVLETGGRLLYIGAGTSGRLGVLDAVECYPTFRVGEEMVAAVLAGGQAAMFHAVENVEDDAERGMMDLQVTSVTSRDAVVGIAASGCTPYVLGAVRYANRLGATTVGLANNPQTPLLEESQIPILLRTGPELLTGSTRLKAGTAQKLVLNMLSSVSMIQLGKVYDNWMVDVVATNRKLQRRAIQIVMEITGADESTAKAALEAHGGCAKPAVLQLLTGVSPREADALLQAANGRLREALTQARKERRNGEPIG